MTTRLLLESDHPQMIDIWQSQEKSMGSSMVRSHEGFYKFLKMGQWESQFVGHFVNDELIGFMRYIKLSNRKTAIVNSTFLKRGGFNVYQYSEGHPFPFIMDYILEDLEKSHIYNWYNHRSNRPAYDRLVEKNGDLLRHCKLGWDIETNQYRYARFIEELVPKDTIPSAEFHKNLLFQRAWGSDVLIIQNVLKQEYRSTAHIKI